MARNTYFSSKLREFQNRHGRNLTASKMASLTGSNPYTTAGWLNGNSKNVSLDFVKACAGVLGLSPEETEELITASEMDKFDENKILKRNRIRDFLDSLHEGILLAEEASKGSPFVTTFSTSEPVTVLNTPAQLANALDMLCQQQDEQEEVCLYLPGTFPELGRILCEHPRQKFTQIFSLLRSTTHSDGGVTILSYLRSIIPALYCCSRYTTLDYYTDGLDLSSPFPWFACTSKGVLIVSGKCTSGMLLLSENASRLYRRSFEELAQGSEPFVVSEAPDAAALPYYEQLVKDLHTPAYSLELSTCLSLFISGYVLESLQTELASQISPELSSMLGPFLEYIGRLQKGYQDYHVTTYFSEGGIRDFIETGWIYALPEEMLPIPPHLRYAILQQMLNEFDKYELYMIRKEFPEENMKFRLYVCGTRGYIQLTSKNNDVLTLDIRNNVLLGLLSNYFNTLNEEFAWSKEESRERLRKLVEECNASLPRLKASEKNRMES